MSNPEISIMVFGQLTDITGTSSLQVPLQADSDSMKAELQKRYPALVYARYIMAVDRKPVTGNVSLSGQSTIALLPPFSGG
ncbi:MoaD/ThiS family protein [Flavihumibacter stibioxidans]|uniref:Molybdopterin synthase sulfur carrier subunit n=1 Tax=Flavihumibacter stibioxidans TaxID=1834163 RepID=A0ABR7MCG7_9BACT|nr:MoaD/ThiS family protein [Flavihumibacter stibioxidans]MBC6492321.1 hypothetical protein [Flavihumibacter stibioxidans]